ncbi:MAG: transporter, partial [Agromyces sp.]|nr:transporter [Agromyces sp.]
LAAAILSGAGIVGGLLAPYVRRLFRKRTSAILLATVSSALVLVGLAFTSNFWIAIVLLAVWGIASSIDDPVHRAYLNDMIPSKQRATVLSFDSLLGSAGGAVFQPILGRSADLGGYSASMLWSGIIAAVATPFVLLSRAQKPAADTARDVTPAEATTGAATPGDDSATGAPVPPV